MPATQQRFTAIIILLFAACFLAIPASCAFGQWPISVAECFRCLWPCPAGDLADTPQWTIITQIRLPRAAAAIICGASLAMAGALLQGSLRNPLADPFTLGISAGAACGASLAIAGASWLLGFLPLHLPLLVSIGALAGGLLALLCALLLGRARGMLSRESVILAGIAVASFLGAIVALVKALNEESVTSIVFWILGSLQGITWTSLPILTLFFLIGALTAMWGWRRLDALSLGDSGALTLGLNPSRCRLFILFGASAMTAGCVAVTGVIGFAGLAVPHMLRLIMGGAHGPLLIASLPAGGLFLLLADTAARTILDGGQELPVGVVTALAGAPIFAFLIWQKPVNGPE